MSEERLFSVKKAKNLSENDFTHLVNMVVEAFDNDPSFGFLFSSREHLRRFIELCMNYYYRSEQAYICMNEEEEICGVSWWVASDGEKMSKRSMKKYGVYKEFTHVMHSLPLQSKFRIIRLSALTEKHHIKQPHSYLGLIASFQKGAGGSLMNDYLASHPSEILYLENSNIEKNTGFYEKHGFKPLPVIKCGELRVLPMIKQ